MKILIPTAVAVVALGAITVLTTAGWDRPPLSYTQTGFRGLAIEQGINPRTQGPIREANQSPTPMDPLPPSDAKPVSKVYKNVQVLGDVKEDAFLALMGSISEWVAPDEGCAFCHNPDNLADDGKYTYKVARRMLQMTRDLNAKWKVHVAASAPTGVTCYTCHRGQPVPGDIWFKNPGPLHALGAAAADNGQNHPSAINVAGLTALNYDPFTSFLADKPENIRIEGLAPLPSPASKATLQHTEKTYALMISIQKALGVNCTFCHNSQQFASWEMSTPKRVTAWHGIQMVRAINTEYLEPLAAAGVFPANRLGPTGDGPKANCGTCHRGVSKPLYGVSLVSSYPALIGPEAK